MKKANIIVLILALLFLLFPALHGVLAEELTPTQALLSDWYAYLCAAEDTYGGMLWALGYVDGFAKEPTWENLLLARAAVSAGERQIFPAAALTVADEELSAMALDGRDVGFVKVELGGWALTCQTIADGYRELRYDLYHTMIFTNYEMEILAEKTDLNARIYEAYVNYLALTTNYLLLQLDDDGAKAQFLDASAENLPYIAAAGLDAYEDKDELGERVGATLDSITQMVTELENLIGRSQSQLNLFTDSVESGDWSEIAGDASRIDGLTLMLPAPQWLEMESATAYYFWCDPDGAWVFAEGRQELKTPEGCVIQLDGVSREQLLAYRDELQGLSIASLNTEDEGDTCTLYYSFAGSEFIFEWQDDAVSIYMLKNPFLFAPYWYLSAIMLS